MRRELTIFSCGGNFDIPQSTVTEEQIKALTGHSSGAIACNVSLTWSWAMTQRDHDDLWRDFPKTATGFEARFATEEDCRAYDRGALGRQAGVRALRFDAGAARSGAARPLRADGRGSESRSMRSRRCQWFISSARPGLS